MKLFTFLLTASLAFLVASCSSGTTNSMVGGNMINQKWQLIELEKNKSPIPIQMNDLEEGAFIRFEPEGKFSGNAACNHFFGFYSFSEHEIIFESVGMTRKMCGPKSMAIEDNLMPLFNNQKVQIHMSDEKIILQNNDTKAVFEKNID